MKTVIGTLGALVAVGALVAAAVVGVGLYNVSARQGHVPGVAAVLHTTFTQSVRLRAPGPEAVPDDLGDPDRVALGAAHFVNACAFCHAVPGQPLSATALSMNPQPPHITEAVTKWQPRHMFWIVREGVRMTGMPHWPAEGRDDEIWSVVAYLETARDMNAEDQATLTGAPRSRASCGQCHGENGRSTNRFVPRLDLLTPDQIAAALTQYREGTRPSGIMQDAAASLTDTQIAALATQFGTTARDARMPAEESEAKTLATRGTAEIPACTACHGPDRAPDTPIAPTIAGQPQTYLATQLRLWRDGRRGGGPRAEVMRKAAENLTDNEIETLAAWFAALQPQ